MRVSKLKFLTKEAWYVINIYVVTDEETVFVIKLIMYTGKYTYSNNENTYMLKTINLVCELCNEF